MKKKYIEYLNRAYFAPLRVITCSCGKILIQNMYYSFEEGTIPSRETCKKETVLAVCNCGKVYFALLPRDVEPLPKSTPPPSAGEKER